ncbi:hypothetical protein [Salinactinospora qingdaonensis]|uniref:LppX_LprAFG lipoprotein n=1 Tax=Salinactinospora qingdaonensis TaxID=702744 RepID=A0ABP7G2E5_9ACTN
MLRKIAVVIAGSGLALAIAGCSAAPGGDEPSVDQSSGGDSSAAPSGGNEANTDPSGGSEASTEDSGIDVSGIADTIKNLVSQTSEVSSYRAEVSLSGDNLGAAATESTQELIYTTDPEPTYKMVMTGTEGMGGTVLMRGDEVLVQGDPSIGASAWMRVEMGSQFQQQPQQDPVAEMRKLLAAEGVEKVGSEEVNGVATTKYEGTYAIDTALERVQDQQTKETARQFYEQMGVSEIAFQVWVGGDGLPRRLVTDASTFVTTMDFLEFNQPVDISYPGPDEIQDMGGMMNDPNGQ